MSYETMDKTVMPRRVGRSIAAVAAGIVAGIVLSLGTDVALHVLGLFPALGQPMSDRLLALATAYRAVYSVLCSYLTARLAPRRPMLHAMVLGVLGLIVSAIGAATTWNRGLGPHWYPVALVVLALPLSWLGGRLRELQLRG